MEEISMIKLTLVFDVVIQNLFDNYYFDDFCGSVCSLRLGCKELKNIIDLNALFQRKKSAYMLESCFQHLSIDSRYIYGTLIVDEYFDKNEYKYIANSIYNIGVGGGEFSGRSYNNFRKSHYDHTEDKLNPLRTMRLYQYLLAKKKIEKSIYLSLALAHAEKPYSFSKAQTIEDRY
jgi:hypothetical protein